MFGVGLFCVGFSPIQKTVAVIDFLQGYEVVFWSLKGFFGAGTTVIFGQFCPKSGKANKLEVMNNLMVTLEAQPDFHIFSVMSQSWSVLAGGASARESSPRTKCAAFTLLNFS